MEGGEEGLGARAAGRVSGECGAGWGRGGGEVWGDGRPAPPEHAGRPGGREGVRGKGGAVAAAIARPFPGARAWDRDRDRGRGRGEEEKEEKEEKEEANWGKIGRASCRERV